MFIVDGPHRVLAAPEKRNIAGGSRQLQRFAPLELWSLRLPFVSINIRLLWS
jgi:hypothetical protein